MGGKLALTLLMIFFTMSAAGAFISDDTWAGVGQLGLVVAIALFMRWRSRRLRERQMMQYAYQPRDYVRHTRSWWKQ